MLLLLVASSMLLAPALSRPQEPVPASPPAAKGPETTPVPIVNQTDETNPDGSFQFSYETANGIKVEEKGYVKEGKNASEKIQVIEGTVTYTDKDGKVINLKYIADENGYRPIGDHIPQAPVIPQADARSGKSLPITPQVAAPQPAAVAAELAEKPADKPTEQPAVQPAGESTVQPAAQPAAQPPPQPSA
ncbi:hypothetical protein JTB14_028403 [Gonioctena quinquepunctata]|nr:hypothetical protein JTB14_028403 [Gonioctena quinquepunctata]